MTNGQELLFPLYSKEFWRFFGCRDGGMTAEKEKAPFFRRCDTMVCYSVYAYKVISLVTVLVIWLTENNVHLVASRFFHRLKTVRVGIQGNLNVGMSHPSLHRFDIYTS